MKIGLFGGTFNPPHNTHVNIARQAIAQLGLDKLLIVPCGTPPHKHSDVDKYARLQLSRIAFAGVGEVWDYEVLKDGKSYTVETLREAKRLYPQAELYLIIGGDSLASFHKWYRPEEIAELAVLAVADRGSANTERDAFEYNGNAKVVCLKTEPNAVSSTEIRLRYQFGKDNGGLVPTAADEYVKANKLYAKYRDMTAKLQTYLTPERFDHTFYVVKRGLELAAEQEYDKAFTACLLHDCAKHMGESDCAQYGFVKPDGMPKQVMHAFLGAEVAKRDFNVTDEEVLDAIRYHATGRPNMTRLDKLVYVADKTEQTRRYPIDGLLKGSLDNMFLLCLSQVEAYRAKVSGNNDFDLTDQTLAFYLND